MSFENWERIPRHPDWKWEYWDGAAQLSYRPYELRLRRPVRLPVPGVRRHQVRLVDPDRDSGSLRTFLSAVWSTEDPCRTFDAEGTAQWLTTGLDSTFAHLAEPAGALAEEQGEIIGAVLLQPPYRERDDEAAGPQLTWLTVQRGFRCDGVGTDLLAAITGELATNGVDLLDSAASAGNRASLVWHWRNGFQNLPDPLARSRIDARHR